MEDDEGLFQMSATLEPSSFVPIIQQEQPVPLKLEEVVHLPEEKNLEAKVYIPVNFDLILS